MNTWIEARWKAIAAFLTLASSNGYAYYQLHQNLTLKDVVASLIAAIIGGGIVHQVRNK